MRKILNSYISMAKFDTNLIIFPFVGAFLIFFNGISEVSFSCDSLGNINTWIGSFATTYFVYMIVDMFISRAPFMKRHRYIFFGLSFVISTVIGECINYKLSSNFGYDLVRRLIPVILVDAVFLTVCVIIGFHIGSEKLASKYEKELIEYKTSITNMDIRYKRVLIKACKKAIQTDDLVFDIITKFNNKEMINSFLDDLTAKYTLNK